MFIFGINLPLPEILFVLACVYTFAIIYFAFHLKKLEKMTQEETKELEELEKIAQEEKEDIATLVGAEKREEGDIIKFEKDIGELEEDTETIYLKKLVPDVYRVQNYVLWALKKGISPDTIKENLYAKGWKDKSLIDMIVNDMSRYVKYYKDKKGKIDLPDVKIDEKAAESVDKIVEVKKPVAKKEAAPKPKKQKLKKSKAKKSKKSKKPSKKKVSTEKVSVEKEIEELERELKGNKKAKPSKKKSKKPSRSKKKAKKPTKQPTKKKSASKPVAKKIVAKAPKAAQGKSQTKQETKANQPKDVKPKSVISVEGNKDFDLNIKIK